MANEYKLKYTAQEIDGKLEKIDQLSEEIVDHKNNSASHVTSAEKAVWNNKADATALPTIVQNPGESESLVMSQKAVTKLVSDALSEIERVEYETVDSVAEMTDATKQYLLTTTGTIWASTVTQVLVENNEFNSNTAAYNTRLNSSAANTTQKGCVTTDYIACDYNKTETVIIKGISKLVENYSAYFTIDYYDANKAKVRSQVMDYHFYADTSTITFPMTLKLFDPPQNTGISATLTNTKYVRIRLSIADNATSVSSADVKGLVINFPSRNSYRDEVAWVDTGLTPEQANNNYVDLLVRVEQNKSDINVISNRVTALETGSGSVTIPSWWENAVSNCVSKIKALQIGRNCVTFPFFSDNHQRNGYAGMLIAKVMQECHIPYCFYGGDSISSGTIADEATMIAQDKAFDESMSYVPNGRYCRAVGNHDGYWYDGTNKYYYDRNQVYELFLREEAIAQNKHFGEDGTYYYVDDLASKMRFIVLNTNGGSVDSAQIEWLASEALAVNTGWAVVIISHHPIANVYHTGLSNAATVINAVKGKNVDIVGWYSGHVHRDRMYTSLYTGGTDTSPGTATSTALGFTQITISSDNTSIAYKNDDGTESPTKHTIANDDQSHAIDFVTINKNTRTVNITRLGIGSDRSYTY